MNIPLTKQLIHLLLAPNALLFFKFLPFSLRAFLTIAIVNLSVLKITIASELPHRAAGIIDPHVSDQDHAPIVLFAYKQIWMLFARETLGDKLEISIVWLLGEGLDDTVKVYALDEEHNSGVCRCRNVTSRCYGQFRRGKRVPKVSK